MLWSKEEYFNSKQSYCISNAKIDAVKEAITIGAERDQDIDDEKVKFK